ncbi:MAG: MFS family permease, partial [Myxococcota bacterium]
MRLATLSALLLGVCCLQVGNGIVATLIPATLGAAGWSEAQIGAVAAALYVGLLAGTGIAPHLINRIGHRRGVALAALLGGASAALLGHSAGPLCGVARLLHGFSLAVLFVAIESWVAEAGGSRRGRAVTAYTSVTYAALAVAPWLVQAGGGFGLAGLMLALVAVPIGWLRCEPARPGTGAGAVGGAPIQPRDLTTALASGATAGALMSLTPLYCQRMGMGNGEMSLFLSAPLVVGLALQAPLGRWLDRPDLDAFGMKFGLAL